MSKIVLVGKKEAFLQRCATKLRWLGYKVLIHKDLMEGLRETLVNGASCIVWDVEENDPGKSRKYSAIKRYHRYTPLIIIDNDKGAFQHDLDSDTFFMNDDSMPDELVQHINDTIPVTSELSDDDQLEWLEKEYEFVD